MTPGDERSDAEPEPPRGAEVGRSRDPEAPVAAVRSDRRAGIRLDDSRDDDLERYVELC